MGCVCKPHESIGLSPTELWKHIGVSVRFSTISLHNDLVNSQERREANQWQTGDTRVTHLIP